MSDRQSQTHVIELTPPGRGAVAVVLVAGPDAVQWVDVCFHPASGRPFREADVDRIVLGRWDGTGGEELIACRRGDGTAEIHCHGGLAAVRGVVERLCALGGTPIDWRDWIRQSEADPIRAAAQIALADAATARTAAILLDQMNGALASAIRRVLAAAYAGDWPAAIQEIDGVLAQRSVGLRLTTPWRVVLAGRPNVGKSSLLNALAGYQRAIVCDQPGTTRDVVTVSTAIDGWPVELADTAGLRETADALESAGVARATAALAEADLVVLIADSTESWTLEGVDAAEPAPGSLVLRLFNKVDLLPRSSSRPFDGLRTSALTGEGIGELVAAIGRALVPAPPPAGTAVPFTAEQVACFEAARTAAMGRDAAAMEASLRALLAP